MPWAVGVIHLLHQFDALEQPQDLQNAQNLDDAKDSFVIAGCGNIGT